MESKLSALILLILPVFVCFFALDLITSAGGGRIELSVIDEFGIIGAKNVRVEAKISKQDYSGPSVGERAEFRLVNPRPGDICTTENPISDNNGIIRGECKADEAGGLTFYVHSFDYNEDSYTSFFQIHNLPPTIPTAVPAQTLSTPQSRPKPGSKISPTPTQTPTPTPKPTLTVTQDSKISLQKKQVKQNRFEPAETFILSVLVLLLIICWSAVVYKKISSKFAIIASAYCLSLISIILVNSLSHRPIDKKGSLTQPTMAPITIPVQIPTQGPTQMPTARPTAKIQPTARPRKITVEISGFVYEDKNCNYKFDSEDSPMPHVKVSIFSFKNGQISTLSSKTYGEDGKYSYTTTINPNETLIVQPSPYRSGYSIIAMSGLPQQVNLSRHSPTAIQDLPMISNDKTSICP